MADVDEFFAEYDAATEDVFASLYQFFDTNLENWFSVIESEDRTKAVLESLEGLVNFDEWYAEAAETQGSMVGSGTLSWPKDQRTGLAMRLSLLRAFEQGKIEVPDFCSAFLYTDNKFDSMVNAVADQIFRPTARLLRKELVKSLSQKAVEDGAPASDRVVSLDHNSKPYRDMIESIESALVRVRESNSFPDYDEKMRLIAEIAAGKTLVEQKQTRTNAIWHTLRAALVAIAKKTADKIVEVAIVGALAAVAAVFGFTNIF